MQLVCGQLSLHSHEHNVAMSFFAKDQICLIGLQISMIFHYSVTYINFIHPIMRGIDLLKKKENAEFMLIH